MTTVRPHIYIYTESEYIESNQKSQINRILETKSMRERKTSSHQYVLMRFVCVCACVYTFNMFMVEIWNKTRIYNENAENEIYSVW